MEHNLISLKDNLNFCLMEDKLNLYFNWRQPQYLKMEDELKCFSKIEDGLDNLINWTTSSVSNGGGSTALVQQKGKAFNP